MKHIYIPFALLLSLIFLAISCRSSSNQEIKVMTFNIRYDNPDDAPNDWKSRKPLIVEFIRSQSPDLLGLQEVLHHQLEGLEADLNEYERYGVGREDGATKGEYSPVLYKKDKFEKLSEGHIWLSETSNVPSKGWDAACERMVVWVKLKDLKSEKEFLFMNTHFDHQGEVARRESAKMIIQLADSLAAGSPNILMGDFNGVEDSEPIQIILDSANSAAFIDTRATAQDVVGEPWTFHDFGKLPFEQRHLIDYIFYRGAITPQSHMIYQESEKEGHIFLSDHTPVICKCILD